MARLLLFILFFSEFLLMLVMARLGPSPAEPSLLVLQTKSQTKSEAAKEPPLSPSLAPEFAQHAWRQASKVKLVTSKAIAAGFIAAFVVAAFVYIRVTRKRATESSKY